MSNENGTKAQSHNKMLSLKLYNIEITFKTQMKFRLSEFLLL